jgi:hypothetical protein
MVHRRQMARHARMVHRARMAHHARMVHHARMAHHAQMARLLLAMALDAAVRLKALRPVRPDFEAPVAPVDRHPVRARIPNACCSERLVSTPIRMAS